MWPQICILVLMGLRMAGAKGADVGPKLVGVLITAWLLYEGGFWSPLFH